MILRASTTGRRDNSATHTTFFDTRITGERARSDIARAATWISNRPGHSVQNPPSGANTAHTPEVPGDDLSETRRASTLRHSMSRHGSEFVCLEAQTSLHEGWYSLSLRPHPSMTKARLSSTGLVLWFGEACQGRPPPRPDAGRTEPPTIYLLNVGCVRSAPCDGQRASPRPSLPSGTASVPNSPSSLEPHAALPAVALTSTASNILEHARKALRMPPAVGLAGSWIQVHTVPQKTTRSVEPPHRMTLPVNETKAAQCQP